MRAGGVNHIDKNRPTPEITEANRSALAVLELVVGELPAYGGLAYFKRGLVIEFGFACSSRQNQRAQRQNSGGGDD